MTVALLALAVVAALLLAAFCAGSETGMFTLNRGRIVHMAREGSKSAKIIERALQEASRTLTGLLVGNNLGSVVFSSASAALAQRLFPGSLVARTAWGVYTCFSRGPKRFGVDDPRLAHHPDLIFGFDAYLSFPTHFFRAPVLFFRLHYLINGC